MMEKDKIMLILGMLVASAACLVIPALFFGVRKLVTRSDGLTRRKRRVSQLLVFSACLLCAVWFLRYAVGLYLTCCPKKDELPLEWWEEIFNSFVHTLQTFSMDEDYTGYIHDGKAMMRAMFGEGTAWQTAYSVYASVLNAAAPVAGGAIVFEILASFFPKIKLGLSYLAFWKEKYFFSQLNEGSVALAKSIYRESRWWLFRPVLVFANVNRNEAASPDMLLEVKQLGAICVPEDLTYVRKNRLGKRKYFLISENGCENLRALTKLVSKHNHPYLKKAEIYFFTEDDAYIQLEKRISDMLQTQSKFKEKNLPTFVPVKSTRNLISNLLVDIPLYEPLIGKNRNDDGTVDLSVTILGTGQIGTEMFLSTYWFGQLLDCNLTVNVVSLESEEEFWNKIDYVNPEIRHTTMEGDPILRINSQGDMASPYCAVNYIQCDVRSSKFIEYMCDGAEDPTLLNTDYFLVALGSDEENVSAANTVRKYVGQHHISLGQPERAVIAYVVFDTDLANTLNRTKRFSYVNGKVSDVYMCAIGSLQEVYSARNVLMTDQEPLAEKAHEAYLSAQSRAKRADKHKERMKDDYKYWASLARGMHIKYKVFSTGLFRVSLFDVDDDAAYRSAVQEAYAIYKRTVTGGAWSQDGEDRQAHLELMHRLAWLEHRRWNAFTRVKGFRHTAAYSVYAVSGTKGSYKQMDIKLHPCLVECDQRGIRARMDAGCNIDETTRFQCGDRAQLDLLDELSYDLHAKKYNDYDFKQYDYPISDF